MPTPTYDLIEEKILGSAQASVTFSSIPGTYRDLVLECVSRSSLTTADYGPNLRLNGDSGSNYSITYVYGNGSTAYSGRASNQSFAFAGNDIANSSGSGWTVNIVNIQSYANANVNKTLIGRNSGASNDTGATVNLWRSTVAITSIALTLNSGNFVAGSTFRLYGIAG